MLVGVQWQWCGGVWCDRTAVAVVWWGVVGCGVIGRQ